MWTHRWGQVSALPPPDAYAFYLPYHYFFPTWWGVYLMLEPTHQLASVLRARCEFEIDDHEALLVTRVFLYAHEAFHHAVESFATRLECTHRKPLYKFGFQTFFSRVYGTDDCTEEVLATAYGYRKVRQKLFGDSQKKGRPH